MNVPDQCWLIKDVPKEFYVQSKKNYRDAIKLVQNTPIDVLKENFAQNDTLRNKWNNLFGNSMQAGKMGIHKKVIPDTYGYFHSNFRNKMSQSLPF